jgi:hypothetical protein
MDETTNHLRDNRLTEKLFSLGTNVSAFAGMHSRGAAISAEAILDAIRAELDRIEGETFPRGREVSA